MERRGDIDDRPDFREDVGGDSDSVGRNEKVVRFGCDSDQHGKGAFGGAVQEELTKMVRNLQIAQVRRKAAVNYVIGAHQ